jgi:cholesterol transport system auxiliary component
MKGDYLIGAAARLALCVAVLALGACSPAAVPDVTYFRMPAATPLPHAATPLSTLPIEVEVFTGEGIYAEQALIYSTSPDGASLRTYHYHLWSDPPSRTLQARLTSALRESGISNLVTDRLPASDQALRIHGRIVRYERVERTEKAFEVQVALEMRVEQDSGEPLIEQTYAAQAQATDTTIAGTVRAFATAVDEVFAKFYADLAVLGKETHAG